MMEGKLTHDERVRLESIAQANVRLQTMSVRQAVADPYDLIPLARRIEEYIIGGNVETTE